MSILLKSYVIFHLLVMALATQQHQQHPQIFWEFKFNVTIHNEFTNNKILSLHCQSKDSDLGLRRVPAGGNFRWSFRLNLLRNTLFWCYMSKDMEHANVKVFWPSEDLYFRCLHDTCDWKVRDDGIYLRNKPEGRDELKYDWEWQS